MKYLILPLIVLFLATSACKKEKQNFDSTAVDDPVVRLTDEYWYSVYPAGRTSGTPTAYDTAFSHRHFEYDEYGYVSKMFVGDTLRGYSSRSSLPNSGVTEYTFTRNSAHKCIYVVVERTGGLTKYSKSNYRYSYDEGNQLKTVEYTGDPSSVGSNIEYFWTDGKITSIWAGSLGYSMSYNVGGNVTELCSYHIVNHGRDTMKEVVETDITYDANPNYINTVKGIDDVYSVWRISEIWRVSAQTFSQNNVIRYGTPILNGEMRYSDFMPTYNEHGYIQQLYNKTYVYEKVKQ